MVVKRAPDIDITWRICVIEHGVLSLCSTTWETVWNVMLFCSVPDVNGYGQPISSFVETDSYNKIICIKSIYPTYVLNEDTVPY